jgi:hypothetical protein
LAATSLEKLGRSNSGLGGGGLGVEAKHNSNLLTSKEEASEKETRS